MQSAEQSCHVLCVVDNGNWASIMFGCHQSSQAEASGPPLQTGVVSNVSAARYPSAKPTGNRSEAVSMVGVFLLWYLWSNNNPKRKGYQCFLETHDRVDDLSPSTTGKLLHTQDYMHPHNRKDIPNHKHNSLFLWSPRTLKISLFPRWQIITGGRVGRSLLMSKGPTRLWAGV